MRVAAEALICPVVQEAVRATAGIISQACNGLLEFLQQVRPVRSVSGSRSINRLYGASSECGKLTIG